MSTMMRKKPTIRDVAQLAGVSYGTVSRYLNGGEHVSPDAAERIAQAISKAQYTPNNAARTLARQRTHAVALIIQVESNETIVQASVSAAMTGANQVLGDAGYQMVTLIANTESSTERILRLVGSDFADGYLLFSMSNDDQFAESFRNVGAPVVRSEIGGDLPYPAVDFTNEQGQYDITRYLLDKGRRRLLYICGPGYSPTALNRYEGFKRAMGDQFREGDVYFADSWEIDNGEMAVAEFESRFVRPGAAAARVAAGADSADAVAADSGAAGAGVDAAVAGVADGIDGVVCANDDIAMGAIRRLTHMGYRVPEDVSVTGFDDSPIALLSDPKLTTVRQDSQLHGETMARLLLDIMDGKPLGERHTVLLPTTIMHRRSA
ncbi:LacI family transcriptional regulator [Bifidobacterium jacchi]|uniref:LacI family transcriptional regulator n=2 Tax=Bifidobacterium jacchi TaxID=2490545 RepID=A0A5N5RMM7_9BIFI|nr:LacI family transcriptional regulator [Bifidobacterium jacchi]